MDRIADDGMLFNHCYVTNSICTPSRAAILTGTHNHVNGVYTLNSKIDKNIPNVAKHLYSHVQGLTITERRRARQACLNCHARKSKCGGETPTCERCRRQGVPCVYQATKRSNFSTTSSGTSVAAERRVVDFSTEESSATRPPLPINGDNNSLLPDKSFVLRVFETFFSLIHPLPAYSFLHKSTVILRYHAGLTDEALLLALIGITSAMTDLGEGMREYSTRCIDASEAIILKNIARPSVVKVQTLVLIIKHRVQTQQSGSAFMLLALASRMAYALRLNFENNQLCFLAQESRRRVMWSIFILDGGFGAGIGDFLLSPPASIHIQLPCPDRNFELDLSVKTESLESSSSGQDLTDKLGLAAYHIRLANVRCKILQYTKQIVVQHHQSAPPDRIPQHVAALRRDLEKFASHLPSRIAFSPNNLRLRAFSPELGSFILIHLWWHQCHLDLYRVGLTGLREALPQSTLERIIDPEFKSLCLQQCFDNSIALYDIFTLLLDLGIRLPPMDIDLPICAYQCARVIFYLHRKHEVLFNLDYERARTCGQRCLDVIAEQSNQGQFISTIRTDLEDLIQRRPSNRSPSPAVTNPAQGPSSDAERPPLLSRHSVIGSINILDGNESLLMPYGAPNKQQQQQQAVSNTPSREEEHRPQRRTRHTQTLDIVLGDVRGRTWEDSDAFQGAFDGIEPESDVYGMGLGAWPTEEWSGNQFEFASSTSVPDMSLRW